jgi:hypothetical protein
MQRVLLQTARLPNVIRCLKETIMNLEKLNQKSISPISRRAACRQMLGMVGAAPFAMSWLGAIQPVLADDEATGNTIRVEEDWYVKIGVPDPDLDSPQITTVIAPGFTLIGSHAIFDMNCATQPGFVSGGVQLQLWKGNSIIQTCSNANWSSLHYVGEEIRFTSAMSVQNGNLVFEILNGSSESWGVFGTGELRLQTPTWRNNLNFYSADFTTENSRIGFASHRVHRLILERIRYYSASGLTSTDNVPRVLHQYDPQA